MTNEGPLPTRLRVLVVAGREPWPLNGGGRLRVYHFLKWLTQQAEVTLALPGPAQYAEHLPGPMRLVNMCPLAAEPGVGRRPSIPLPPAAQPATATGAGRLIAETDLPARRHPWVVRRVGRHFGTNATVRRWLVRNAQPGQFDVALLCGAVTGQYIDALRVPAIWDAVDELVLYTLRDARRRGARQWFAVLRAAVLYAAFERYVARRASATVFTSTVDASFARRWVGGARIEAVTNGVDLDYFGDGWPTAERGTVAFVGSLSFPPNVEAILRFATRIWPRVRGQRQDRRLLVVGRSPVPAVRELARLSGIEVHADVPDVRPYIARAAVVVVPTLLGGGVKNKILEACAMGRPVIASPRALAGLSARRGTDLLCASTEAAWVAQLSRLLENPTQAATIGQNGRRWVAQAHNWPTLAGRLRELLWQAADELKAAHQHKAACRRRAAVQGKPSAFGSGDSG